MITGRKPLELMEFQNNLIEYLCNIIQAYVTIYQKIGEQIKQGEDEEGYDYDGLQDEIETCFEAIQPLLTLSVDLHPDNVEKTLSDYKFRQLKHKGNNTLN